MTRNAVSWLLSGAAAVCLMLILTLCLPGCATVNPEMAQHMAGVAKALETLPAAPVNAETQAQISGWSAWASFLLKAASGL